MDTSCLNISFRELSSSNCGSHTLICMWQQIWHLRGLFNINLLFILYMDCLICSSNIPFRTFTCLPVYINRGVVFVCLYTITSVACLPVYIWEYCLSACQYTYIYECCLSACLHSQVLLVCLYSFTSVACLPIYISEQCLSACLYI